MIRSRGGFPARWTIADLLEHLGGISPQRIRLRPAPGKATERHVLAIQPRLCGFPECWLCERLQEVGEFKTPPLAQKLWRMEAFLCKACDEVLTKCRLRLSASER